MAEMKELARKRLHWEFKILGSRTTNKPVVTGRGDSGGKMGSVWGSGPYHLLVQ